MDKDIELKIPGFQVFTKLGKRKHTKGRAGGGITVLVKQEIGNLVKLIPNRVDEVIWLELTEGESKTVLGFSYVFPEGSPFARDDVFEAMLLEKRDLEMGYGGVEVL